MIKLSNKALLVFAIFSFYFLLTKFSLAWSGYDFENKIDIDIGQGNLVREGLIIEFYDAKSDSYHQGKILLLESDPGGTMLLIKDLDLNLERTFIMQN